MNDEWFKSFNIFLQRNIVCKTYNLSSYIVGLQCKKSSVHFLDILPLNGDVFSFHFNSFYTIFSPLVYMSNLYFMSQTGIVCKVHCQCCYISSKLKFLKSNFPQQHHNKKNLNSYIFSPFAPSNSNVLYLFCPSKN